MSFLLDALRKSEGRKHRGDVPTIHSSQSVGLAPDAGRRKGPLILVLLPAFLVLIWFGSRQFTGNEPAPAAPPPAAVSGDPDPQTAAADTGTGAAIPPTRDSANPAPGAESPVRETLVPDRSASADAFAREEPGPAASRTPVEDFEAPEPGSAEAPPDMVLRSLNMDEQRRAATPQSPAAAAGPEPVPEAEPEPEPDRDTYRAPRPSEISYWALPGSVRQDLPEFRISVLVYAERPADRFLLLNGQRQVEGDEYQPGLVLEEIRRDGAIFSYRLYRFLVTQ